MVRSPEDLAAAQELMKRRMAEMRLTKDVYRYMRAISKARQELDEWRATNKQRANLIRIRNRMNDVHSTLNEMSVLASVCELTEQFVLPLEGLMTHLRMIQGHMDSEILRSQIMKHPRRTEATNMQNRTTRNLK